MRGVVHVLCSLIITVKFLGIFAQQKAFNKCNEYYGLPDARLYNLNIEHKDIAGGYSAKHKELPFMAALGYEVEGKITYFCGGSLISEDFVITAAHCVYSKSGGFVKYVRVGDLNLNSSEDDEYAQMFKVKKPYVHPEYKFPEKYHDIALIELTKRVRFLKFIIMPICLSLGEFWHEYIIGGWGQREYGMSLSNELQIAFLRSYHIKFCQKQFIADITLPEGISKLLQLCAGPIDKIADTCEGDSGGPLAYVRKNAFYLAGITSFGKPCALDFYPGVYTNVFAHIDWIENTVWPERNENIAGENLSVTNEKSDSKTIFSFNICWFLLQLYISL